MTGIVFGLLHNVLFNNGWHKEYLGIWLAFWVIGNFVLGAILMRKAQEKSKDFSATLPIKPVTKFIETGARQNIFLMLFSIYLVLAAFFGFIFVFYEDVLLIDAASILYGIASILAGVSFILKEETPRNFGFITLVSFLLLEGIAASLDVFIPDDYPPVLLTLLGMISLASGIFFVSRREIWKNPGFMLVSGYLISISLAFFLTNLADLTVAKTFVIIAAVFAVLAAVVFFLRKEHLVDP